MIVRIQATWTVLLLLCAVAWLCFALPDSWAMAVGGLLAAALFYLGVMA